MQYIHCTYVLISAKSRLHSLVSSRNQSWEFPPKKLNQKTEQTEQWFVRAEFQLFRGTENSRNSVSNHSAVDKNARNSVPWNKIRSKHLDFFSEQFRGRENNSEFRSEACLGQKHAVNSVCWRRNFCKTNFFHAFPSVPRFQIDSFVNLRIPRSEHFLLRNNRSCSKSIPRNEIPLPTLLVILLCNVFQLSMKSITLLLHYKSS